MSPADPKPRRRVLFVLRGKLGDTVVSFATVRAFADAFPDDDVTLLVRASYAPLFRNEQGIRVVGFSSRVVMFAKLAMMRWLEPPFDALLVLLGSGALPQHSRIPSLAAMRRPSRVIGIQTACGVCDTRIGKY